MKIFLGRFRWAKDQAAFILEDAFSIIFEKKEPWDIRWFLSRSSYLHVFLYTSYWMLVWLEVDFQSAFISSFWEILSAFRGTDNWKFGKLDWKFGDTRWCQSHSKDCLYNCILPQTMFEVFCRKEINCS